MEILSIIKPLTVFFISLIAIRVLIHLAPRLGLVDIPNHRSVHKHAIPRGAGIGMMAGLVIADAIFLNANVIDHFLLYFSILIVFLAGVLDDRYDISARKKFLVIFIGVFFLYLDGITIPSLGRFFGVELLLGWFALPFTMFAVAGFTNALNLVDGIDGLAGWTSLIIFAALCAIGFQHNDTFIVSFSLSFMAAIAAFLMFNWHPARIFMGDSGSLTLGFAISITAIKALPYMQPSAILFIAAVPIMDTLIVMTRRFRQGRSPCAPDKTHIHHILLNFFNGNVRKTVLLLMMMQGVYSLMGLDFIDYPSQRYLLLLFTLNLAIFYLLLNGMLTRQTSGCTEKEGEDNSRL